MANRGPYETQTLSTNPSTFGERLRFLRVRAGLTQLELGQSLGTDQTLVSSWERDRARPSSAALTAIAGRFGVTPDALETGEGLLDAEPLATRTFSLLPAGAGESASAVTVLDESTGATRSLEHLEALSVLMEALKAGRKALIVLRQG